MGPPHPGTSSSRTRYAEERLPVDKLDVAASDAALTITGNLPVTDEAEAGEIDLNLRGNLATVAHYLPPETNIAADGAVELTGTLRGTLKRIEPNLMLTVDNGLILSPTLEPGFSKIT